MLVADRQLINDLGGNKVYDRVPEGTTFPYISVATLSSRDASTASEDAVECRLTLNIWSQQAGKRETLALMQRVRRLLHDQQLNLRAHTLVNLREEFADISQTPNRSNFRGSLRFRAVIELDRGEAP